MDKATLFGTAILMFLLVCYTVEFRENKKLQKENARIEMSNMLLNDSISILKQCAVSSEKSATIFENKSQIISEQEKKVAIEIGALTSEVDIDTPLPSRLYSPLVRMWSEGQIRSSSASNNTPSKLATD